MAPKPPSSKTSSKVRNKNPKARKSATAGPSTISKSKVQRTTKQVKTKPVAASLSANRPSKKKQRVYSDKELKLPTLNMITPAGITKPVRGKKKGKVFIDDQDSMMTILALVNAQKEGQIESKIMRERQLEEVREARRKEAEKRKDGKREVLEGKMREVKRKRGKGHDKAGEAVEIPPAKVKGDTLKDRKVKKRVSFA